MQDVVAIIPARSGSKSVPNKNIASVGGKPLIHWTITAACDAQSVTRVIVSTDSLVIADAAKNAGAEVPFLRPSELARDDTPGIAPILHALNWLAETENYHPEMVICLQPTSPLRTADDIDAAVALLHHEQAYAVVSGVPAAYHPYWMKQLDPSGRVLSYVPSGDAATRRQDLPPLYALNGAIYLARSQVLIEQSTWYTDRTFMYVMPEDRSLDIDTPWDLYLADLILSARQ